MSCPFAGTPPAAVSAAPLAAPLSELFPDPVNLRYRSIEDPAVVRQILRHPEDFTPANALSTAIDLTPAALRILASAKFALPPVLASASGPEHLAVRRVVARFFSPAKVAAQSWVIRSRVAELCRELEQCYGGGGVDLAEGLAAVIPPEIMARLTGIPVPPMDSLKRWSQDSLELFWGWPDAARQLVLAHSAAEFYMWLGGTVDEALARDDGNLYAALRQAGVDRRRIISLGYFLGIAGQETTAMLIQTTLFSALHDGRWESCADPDTGERAAEEVVREVLARASSVPTWRRLAVTDLELAGEGFRAGEQLVLRLSGGLLGAAGDDSLAFGYGLHRCIGAGLARMETELVLHAAARALPELELVPHEPVWSHLLSFQAPVAVPTRMRTATPAQPEHEHEHEHERIAS